jgi:Tfp pilus assembly protein PilF
MARGNLMAISIFGFRSSRRYNLLPPIFAFSALFTLTSLVLPAQDRLLARTPDLPMTPGNVLSAPDPQPTLSPEETGDIQMARRGYQAAIQAFMLVSPKSASVWNKIGIAYQQMYVTDQARKSYETALKLDPKNTNVMNNLGTVYYSLKQYRNAEQMYRKSLNYGPKSALVYKNLGTALMAENKFKKGWECYQEALQIDSEIFERASPLRIGEPTPVLKRGAMNYYLAKSYLQVGMLDRAVGYLRMAIDEGFTDRKKVMADKEFASLRGVSSFEEMMSEQRAQ